MKYEVACIRTDTMYIVVNAGPNANTSEILAAAHREWEDTEVVQSRQSERWEIKPLRD